MVIVLGIVVIAVSIGFRMVMDGLDDLATEEARRKLAEKGLK